MVSAALAIVAVVPPILADNVIVPLVFAGIAVVLGGIAIHRGENRLGSLALFAASIGGVGGALFANTDSATVENIVTAGLFASTLRFATPLVLGGLGGVFSERSGVTNIAIEGMMLMGCFWGFWASTETLSWPIGLAAAMAAGGLSALIHAFFSIHLGANQIISGTAINILALGVTSFAYRSLIGSTGTPDVDRIPNVHLPLISEIPFVGDIIGDLNLMVWVMFALVDPVVGVPDADGVGPAPAVGRRASARGRHRRHRRVQACATWRSSRAACWRAWPARSCRSGSARRSTRT